MQKPPISNTLSSCLHQVVQPVSFSNIFLCYYMSAALYYLNDIILIEHLFNAKQKVVNLIYWLQLNPEISIMLNT